MLPFSKAMTALYALTQINNVQSQEMSTISTRDSYQLSRVLEQGCDYIYDAPVTGLKATHKLIASIQESSTTPFTADSTNPDLHQYRSKVIAQILETTTQIQHAVSEPINLKKLAGLLQNLAEILESNNMALIHPGLATPIQLLISQVATMLSSNHIAAVKEKAYRALTGQDQKLQLALRAFESACKTNGLTNIAYHSYCNEYFQWQIAMYLALYQQLLYAPTFADQEMIKLTMQEYHTAFSRTRNTCKVVPTVETYQALRRVSEYLEGSSAETYECAQQM